MFEILRKSLSVGVVTTSYPDAPSEVSSQARGRPDIDFAQWKDARLAAQVCPTQAIACRDTYGEREATLDLGKCVFCGLCAETEPAIRMTANCLLATAKRNDLKQTARYRLSKDGRQERLLEGPRGTPLPRPEGILPMNRCDLSSKTSENSPSPIGWERAGVRVHGARERASIPPSSSNQSGGAEGQSLDDLGAQLQKRITAVLGRSLHIREVDAGSCNGCEVEIQGLNSPVYDLERFGIHFVASPRHADMLLVTGPVTRNMELALRKTYDATPSPRLVVAVGACGCTGGIFGQNYASLGGVDRVLPVDVYVPGCPPNPHALLHGILLAVGRWRGTAA